MLRTSATSTGPAPSVKIATNGSAMRVIRLPKIDTVAAVHTRAKARFCHSERVGRTSGVGGVGSIAGSSGSMLTGEG
jgi:hypothetical protein